MASLPPSAARRQDPFVAHCVELLAPLGAVRTRRMFGGWGLYVDDLFIAIIAFERLYLKADADTAPRFAAAGCQVFTYEAQGRRQTMGYWTAPTDAMDAAHEMQPWARLALQAALSARAAKTGTTGLSKPARSSAAKPPAKTSAAQRRR